jgi:hypothetical protein
MVDVTITKAHDYEVEGELAAVEPAVKGKAKKQA